MNAAFSRILLFVLTLAACALALVPFRKNLPRTAAVPATEPVPCAAVPHEREFAEMLRTRPDSPEARTALQRDSFAAARLEILKKYFNTQPQNGRTAGTEE